MWLVDKLNSAVLCMITWLVRSGPPGQTVDLSKLEYLL
jgi:hypothetical protein